MPWLERLVTDKRSNSLLIFVNEREKSFIRLAQGWFILKTPLEKFRLLLLLPLLSVPLLFLTLFRLL